LPSNLLGRWIIFQYLLTSTPFVALSFSVIFQYSFVDTRKQMFQIKGALLVVITGVHAFHMLLWTWCQSPIGELVRCFNSISVIYRGGQFYWWRKTEYPEKTTDLPQVADTHLTYSCIEYTSPWAGFDLTLVVIGTDCIGSCKFNYHTITSTTVPLYWYCVW
jgi:hypothetical protein